MITVEINSMLLDRSYDFRIDEFTEIGTVVDEVLQMFCQKEQCSFSGNPSDAALYSEKARCIFNSKNCLNDYHITTGDRLILI